MKISLTDLDLSLEYYENNVWYHFVLMTPIGCLKYKNTLVTRPGAPVDCLVPSPVHPDVRIPTAGSHPVQHLIRLPSLVHSLLTLAQKSLSEYEIDVLQKGVTRKK